MERVARDEQQPGTVRVAALKELPARGLGSPDLTSKQAPDDDYGAKGGSTALESGRRRLALGVPFDRLPLAC